MYSISRHVNEMQVQEKRPFGLYSLAPSFSRVQFIDTDMVIYLGAHKPRGEGTKNMVEVKLDPDAFLPKMDVSIFTLYGGESFPVYARDASRLVAAITILNATPVADGVPFGDKTMAIVNSWRRRPDLPDPPYLEFNPNKMTFKDMIKFPDRYGHPAVQYNIVDPMKRQRDILWLRKSAVVMKRALRDKQNTFTKDIMAIGKDIKHNEIVIGFKKESRYVKYARIVPLYMNGLYFAASMRFMAIYRPARPPLISDTTFDRLVQETMTEMRDVDLVPSDLTMKASDFLETLHYTSGRETRR
jgi:hypothetical protein